MAVLKSAFSLDKVIRLNYNFLHLLSNSDKFTKYQLTGKVIPL